MKDLYMNKELEKKLSDKFPFMKKGKSLIEQHNAGFIDDLYSAFGLECGDGWYDLIYELCTEIQKAIDESRLPVNVEINQVKEKYGGLRFYYSLNFKENGLGSIDANKRKELSEKIFKLTNIYEDKSYGVCELCGKPGKLREDLDWMQTLCEECYSKVKDKKC